MTAVAVVLVAVGVMLIYSAVTGKDPRVLIADVLANGKPS